MLSVINNPQSINKIVKIYLFILHIRAYYSDKDNKKSGKSKNDKMTKRGKI